MTDAFDFDLRGVEELQKKLDSIQYDLKKRGGRFALRKAANVIKEAAALSARQVDDPATRENIAKNIAVRWNGRVNKRTGDLGFRVGVLGGAKQYVANKQNIRSGRAGTTYATGGDSSNPGGDTWYWRFLEFGTKKISERNFMRRALRDNAENATTVFVENYDKALDRAIKRQAR